MFTMLLPDYVLNALNELQQGGFKAYCVGGCVRDALMGKAPDDYDIAATSSPEQTLECFSSYKTIETGIKHGTVTVVSGGHNLEITTCRTDGAYLDSRRPQTVNFTHRITEDLSRRDFTINAMAYSPEGGLIDNFGGEMDIKNRLIKCVGEPDRRFGEDALRIMRALRFSSVLGFSIEEKTAQSVRKNRELLKNISSERIFTELKKLLAGKAAVEAVTEYRDVLEAILPEIAEIPDSIFRKSAGCINPEHAQAVNFYRLLPGLSEQAAQDICKRLKADNKFISAVKFLAAHARDEYTRAGEIKRLAGAFGIDNMLRLSEYSEGVNDSRAVFIRSTLLQAQKEDECLSLRDLKINGRDIKALGVSGERVGELLTQLLTQVTDGVITNEKAVLIARAKSLSENTK